jgi:hypothetical protein
MIDNEWFRVKKYPKNIPEGTSPQPPAKEGAKGTVVRHNSSK